MSEPPAFFASVHSRHSLPSSFPRRRQPGARRANRESQPRRERGRPARIIACQPRILKPSKNRERQTPSCPPVIPAKAAIRSAANQSRSATPPGAQASRPHRSQPTPPPKTKREPRAPNPFSIPPRHSRESGNPDGFSQSRHLKASANSERDKSLLP